MPKKSRPYKVGLHERLKDRNHALSYINATLEEDTDEGLLIALREVAEATLGMKDLAEAARVNRENLYRMLSDSGNPRWSSLRAVMKTLGLKFEVVEDLVKTSLPATIPLFPLATQKIRGLSQTAPETNPFEKSASGLDRLIICASQQVPSPPRVSG